MGDRRKFVLSSLPPSINHQKAAVRGRLIKTAPYRLWITQSQLELMAQPGFYGDLIERPFIWRCGIAFPCNKSKMDIDNVGKAIVDVLVSSGKVPDDRYLAEITIRWSTTDRIKITTEREDKEKWAQTKTFSQATLKKLR